MFLTDHHSQGDIGDIMPTYVYKKDRKPTRKSIIYEVYLLQGSKRPKYIGETKAHSSSYKGDKPHVASYLSKKFGYRMKDGYHLARKDVFIYEI